jgi:hypothetical protein
VTAVHTPATGAHHGGGTVAAMTAPALLAISHGTASVTGAGAVATLVDAVAHRLGDGVPVHAGFVDVQQPDVPTCLAGLRDGAAGATVVVPLLLSAGYHVHVDLREDVEKAVAAGQRVTLGGALGPDDRLVALLVRRLAAATAGFGFKLSMVPFQMWTPDVYEGAPTPVAARILAPSIARPMLLRMPPTSLVQSRLRPSISPCVKPATSFGSPGPHEAIVERRR